MADKPNKTHDIIQPGEPVVLLTYMVGLCPDGDAEHEYEPRPVHLRKRPETYAEIADPAHPDQALRDEILRRAEKLERREHDTPRDRKFTIGALTLVRQREDVAR